MSFVIRLYKEVKIGEYRLKELDKQRNLERLKEAFETLGEYKWHIKRN